jgi:hypothetical protein
VHPPVAPGGVLPRQPQHQIPQLTTERWPAASSRIPPAPTDQIPVPSQQRLRLDQPRLADPTRDKPDQPGQHGTIGPVHARPAHLAPQHRHLVPQDQRLGVPRRRLLAINAIHRTSRQKIKYRGRDAIRPACRQACDPENTRLIGRDDFWHPQAHSPGTLASHRPHGLLNTVPRSQRPGPE